MGKTDATKALERDICIATRKQSAFGCFEVTIGWFGKERVDYLTYDRKGAWRCYEIKTSLSDFRSKAAVTFIGHFNYYVLTPELFERVKGEIPDGIGVYVGKALAVRPKRQPLGVSEKVLWESMIRSLSREVNRAIDNDRPDIIARYKHEANRWERECREWRERVHSAQMELSEIRRSRRQEPISKEEAEREDEA